MERYIAWLKCAVVVVGAWLSYMLGGWDMALQVLVAFIVADYIVGVTAAWFEKKLDSRIGSRGIAKKILCIVPVAVAYWLDQLLGSAILRNIAIWFYIANEGLSILENLGRCGVPIPGPLLEALQQLRKKSEEAPQVGQ